MVALGNCAIFQRKNSRMYIDKIFSERNTVLYATLVCLVYIVYRISLIGLATPDIGGVEGNILYFIQRILDGQPFYTDPEKTPYAIAQYSPGYYYIVAAVAKLADVGPDNYLLLSAINRSVSLFFNIGYIITVFLLCRMIFSISMNKSVIASSLSFVFLEITSYGRPDSCNHVLFMLAIYFFMLGLKKEEMGKPFLSYVILAAITAAIALFSKQTSFVLPLLAGSWLLWKKKYRLLVYFSGTYFVIVAIFLFWINYALGLTLFYKNAVLGINNGIQLGWFRRNVFETFYIGYGFLFACFFIATWFILKKEKSNLLHYSATAMVGLFIILNFITLKNGSNPGYLTEWWTLVIILSAAYWQPISSMVSPISYKLPAVIVWLVLSIKLFTVSQALLKTTSAKLRTAAKVGFVREKELAIRIESNLESSDKYVVFLNYHTADGYLSNLLFRNAVGPQMDIIGLASYQGRVYDYSDLDRSLTDGSIKLMVTKANGHQKQFFGIRLDNFNLIDSAAGYKLYQFKP